MMESVEAVLLYCAVIVVGGWFAIKPQSMVRAFEKSNNSFWKNPNLTAIRLVNGVAAVAAAVYLLIRLQSLR